jgi:hypothetical protein
MDIELLSLLGGGVSGFVMKFIATMASNQANQFKMMLEAQGVADDSHDRASARGGVWVRRAIVAVILFAVVVAPYILAYSNSGVTVFSEYNFLGIIPVAKWETLQGMVLLPEVRQSLLAIVGFYFGSSQVK